MTAVSLQPVSSRFLTAAELPDTLGEAIARTYRGTPHPYGARHPERVRLHWSREWEYPYAAHAVWNIDGTWQDQLVLDVGCGGSPLLPWLAQQGAHVLGLDAEDVTVGVPSLRSYGSVPPGVWLVRQDLFDPWPVGAGALSAVTCLSVLEALSPLAAEQVLAEAARVLRPRGRLIITVDVGRTLGDEAVFTTLRAGARGLRAVGPEHLDVRPDLDTLPGTYHVAGFVWERI